MTADLDLVKVEVEVKDLDLEESLFVYEVLEEVLGDDLV